MRSARGQASLEYVGLLALLAVVLSGTAALVNWALGDRIAWTIRTGLCLVAHTACPPPPSDRGSLAPCPETRDASRQDFGVSVAFVDLGAGLGVRRETFSDGHVELTFVDDGHGGLTGGAGLDFQLGGKGKGIGAGGELNVGWTQGRKWSFANGHAADAFVARYGSDQKLLGRGLHLARRVCWLLCDGLGIGDVDDPPPPDERYDELGGHAEASAAVKKLVKADGSAAVEEALGWRRRRDGGGSLYLRVDERAAGQLALLGARGTASGRAVGALEIEYDADHRPVALRMTSGQVTTRSARPPGQKTADVPELLEVVVDLDLRGPDGRRVLSRFLHAVRPDRLVTSPDELASLLRRAASRATLTARAYRTADAAGGIGGHVGVGARFGGEIGHSHSTAALQGEWMRLPGSPWLPRADCRFA